MTQPRSKASCQISDLIPSAWFVIDLGYCIYC